MKPDEFLSSDCDENAPIFITVFNFSTLVILVRIICLKTHLFGSNK